MKLLAEISLRPVSGACEKHWFLRIGAGGIYLPDPLLESALGGAQFTELMAASDGATSLRGALTIYIPNGDKP